MTMETSRGSTGQYARLHIHTTFFRIPHSIMAKTSGRSSDIQSLLTAAEKKLLDGTLGKSLAAATQPQLEAMRKQARVLRDKWQDLFKRQSITTKRSPASPTNDANSRSREKADLFSDAIKRVEARLTEIATSLAGTKPSVKAGRPSAARASTKPTRQAAHRATRATIRGELAEAMAAINATTKKIVAEVTGSLKKPIKKSVAAPAKLQPATAKQEPNTAMPRKPKPTTKPVTSKKARQAGRRKALAATGANQLVTFDTKKQRSAKARATIARLKVDGEATRRKGFVVSNTKRKQAKRDSR